MLWLSWHAKIKASDKDLPVSKAGCFYDRNFYRIPLPSAPLTFGRSEYIIQNDMCLPGCEFSNSPISVDPLLHEVTNKVLTKVEVIFWGSSKWSGVGNLTFPLNISKDAFINKTNTTRLTTWTSIWFVLVFVMVIRVSSFQGRDTKLEIFLPKYQQPQRKFLNLANWCSGQLSKIGHYFGK